MKHYALLCSVASLVLFAASSCRAAEAPGTWGTNCASCHGADGGGHTKAGRLVGTKDLTDAAYQKTFTDDQAFTSVKDGFKDSSGTVKMKPSSGKLSDEEIKTLVAYIRTLAK